MIEVYIGLHAGGWALDGRTQGWSAHDDPAQGLERWALEIGQRHGGKRRRARADLWLSGGLARPFLCGPVEGLTGWREAETFAAALAPEATGLAGTCHVRLEDWPGDASALATAIDASLAASIDAVAASCRIAWRGIRPRWAAALDDMLAQRPSTALVAVAEEDALTLLCCSPTSAASPSGLEFASTYAPAPDSIQATALWHRMGVSHDLLPDDAWLVRVAQPDEGIELEVPPAKGRGDWPRLVQLDPGIAS